MSKVLIPLSILAAFVAALVLGKISRSGIGEYVHRLKLKGSICASALSELIISIKSKGLAGRLKPPGSLGESTPQELKGAEPDPGQDLYAPLDMSILNCNVRTVELKEGNAVFEAFAVELCGSIHAPDDVQSATLKISIVDVTNGSAEASPVRAKDPQGTSSGESGNSEFCYMAPLGRLPQQTTTLEDWTSVARLRTDEQEYCRRGKRTLRLDTTILSADRDLQLAQASCTFVYDNPLPGYIDLKENTDRTKVLSVALAFSVSAADGKLFDCEVELIKDWARENVLDTPSPTSDQGRAKLEKALSTTVAFFREGNKLDTQGLCGEIVDIVPVGQRYEVMELCLRVAKAKGSVAAEEMRLLRDMAVWLEIDSEKFRAMVEKILPVDMHEVMDLSGILGITSDMSREKTRKHLNREYSKWNSRVTCADPEIQSQADQMLKLIVEARGQYVASRK